MRGSTPVETPLDNRTPQGLPGQRRPCLRLARPRPCRSRTSRLPCSRWCACCWCPRFLLMKHRGVDLVPLVLAALGWISFLASCLVNDVSVLWPNALAPAAFSLYLIGLTVLTGRAVDRSRRVLAGIAAGTLGLLPDRGDRTDPHRELPRPLEIRHRPRGDDPHRVRLDQGAGAPTVHPVVLALLGLASLGLNFRSHALVCLLASATLFTRPLPGFTDPAWVAVRRDHRVRALLRIRDAVRRTGRACSDRHCSARRSSRRRPTCRCCWPAVQNRR